MYIKSCNNINIVISSWMMDYGSMHTHTHTPWASWPWTWTHGGVVGLTSVTWTSWLQDASFLGCPGHRKFVCFSKSGVSSLFSFQRCLRCFDHFGSPCTKRGRMCGFRWRGGEISIKVKGQIWYFGVWADVSLWSTRDVNHNLSKTKLCTVQTGDHHHHCW